MKIAILGGTFDPIHRGHLQIARNALDGSSVDQVFFIPCAIPPHKTDSKLVGARHRMAMVRAAIAEEPGFQALDIEIKRGGTSYSIDTLRQLRKERARDQFFFLLGSDNLQSIGTWRDFHKLIQLCEFLVIKRPGSLIPYPLRPDHPLRFSPLSAPKKEIDLLRFHVLKGPTLAIASSDIRRRLREGKKVSHLIPPTVHKYIQTHRLYCSPAPFDKPPRLRSEQVRTR